MRRLTRYELFNEIIKAYPSMKCFFIEGQGYNSGYVNRDDLLKVFFELKVHRKVGKEIKKRLQLDMLKELEK